LILLLFARKKRHGGQQEDQVILTQGTSTGWDLSKKKLDADWFRGY
jgi:hypothetical protein